MRRPRRGLQAVGSSGPGRKAVGRRSEDLGASKPEAPALGEWEEVKGLVTRVERNGAYSCVTVRPLADEVYVVIERAGAGMRPARQPRVGDFIEILRAGQKVKWRFRA